jgi:hypothetical protein
MGELQVVRKRTLVIAAVAALSAIAPISEALRVAPLKTRNGIVVTWRPQNGVAIVAQPSGNLLAIHALRKVAPGTRVTVSGIKWGTPTSGIKWGTPAHGIKWGIKWGRNGSYQSGLRKKKAKKAVWTPVRGPIVKRIGKKAVAVGTPGGVVVFRVSFARIQGHVANAVATLPPVGATISVRVFFGKKGVKFGRDIKYLKPPVPGASLPFAGRIRSINLATRTMVVEDDQDPAYLVRVKVKLPREFTLTPYTVGEEVAVAGTLAAGGTLALTAIGPNANFDQADDPTAVQILTTGQPACANAVEFACPTDPATASGGDPLLGPPPPGAGAPQTSSSSPPTPPSPPAGSGNPPPPPVCDGPGHPGGNEAQVDRHRAPNCVPRPCAVPSPRHGDRPHPCRLHRGQQRTP